MFWNILTMLLSRNLTGVRVTTGMKQLAERLLERQELSKVETWQDRFSPTSRTCLKGKRISKRSPFERIHTWERYGWKRRGSRRFQTFDCCISCQWGSDPICQGKGEGRWWLYLWWQALWTEHAFWPSICHNDVEKPDSSKLPAWATAFMQRNSFVGHFRHNLREVWSLEKYRDKQTEMQLRTNAETHTAHVTRHYWSQKSKYY